MTDPEKENKEDIKALYDLAIPIGMPVSVINELVDEFELDPVRRNARVGLIDEEEEEREILVLRGELDTVMAAKKYMFEALDKRVKRWDEGGDRAEQYKKLYYKTHPPQDEKQEE
ncbi:MAG: hypothetical protein D4Q77_02040 [Methanothrix sp.]|nr:MAG: hypothetical protein D4Q77_02040 [Methanothrix sp.]